MDGKKCLRAGFLYYSGADAQCIGWRHRSANDSLSPLSIASPPEGAPDAKDAWVPQRGGRDLTPALHSAQVGAFCPSNGYG